MAGKPGLRASDIVRSIPEATGLRDAQVTSLKNESTLCADPSKAIIRDKVGRRSRKLEHDERALRAFETGALDYLVKPFAAARGTVPAAHLLNQP